MLLATTRACEDRVQGGILYLKDIQAQPLPRWQIFVELEFLNSGKLLYIFETVVDPHIYWGKRKCYLAILAGQSVN